MDPSAGRKRFRRLLGLHRALLLGAAGLLAGRKATTHWTAMDLLPLFGAVTVHDRVVRDGKFLFAAGVTAGIDGALELASGQCGEAIAQQIQLSMEYDPKPPFRSGTPEQAPAGVLAAARSANRNLAERRLETATRLGRRFRISSADKPTQ